MDDLLRDILTSKVYEAAIETALDPATELSSKLQNTILLKREDQQPIFSFKIRGAYNKIAHLTDRQKTNGVIAASAGNHAQGVAFSAKKLGMRAVIVMPQTTPLIKVEAVKRFGGEVILHGTSYSEAAEKAETIQRQEKLNFIHPFDDPLVIAGQGTIGLELLRQHPAHIDAIFVPIGGGGLIAGIAAYIKSLRPEIRVVGVEPRDSDAMARSIENGELYELPAPGIFADGVAVKKVGTITYDVCRRCVDDIVRVSNDELCSGIKTVYQSTRAVVEPAGALALTGLLRFVKTSGCKGKTFIAINSGANMNFERLRYVAERTLIGDQLEALFAVSIPEQPGSLKRFCHDLVGERNITEFNYRLSSRAGAQIFVGISIRSSDERKLFAEQLTEAGYDNIDLTDNSLAKTHIRYMVGGRSPEVRNERLFRFWFPETPGALSKFLDATRGKRNISLFHYRMQGGDYGRVLVGFEFPDGDDGSLEERLSKLGYRYQEETDNPAYSLFL